MPNTFIYRINVLPGTVARQTKITLKSGKGIYVDKSADEVDRAIMEKWESAGPEFQQAADALIQRMGSYALSRFKYYFKPGGKFDLGASGKSAKNFSLEGHKGEWYITTGSLTKGNYFVKHGFGHAGGKNSRDVGKDKRIRMWMAAKGINLREYGQDTSRIEYYKKNPNVGRYVTQRSKYGNRYARLLKKESPQDKAFKFLRWHLSKGSKYSEHLVSLYPAGRPYFDYAAYLMKHDSRFWQLVASTNEEALTAFIRWFSTSKKEPALREFGFALR